MADKLKLVDQYAIMLLEPDPNAYSEEWNADYERGFSDAIDKALELPTIEAETDNGWINVKDRLPDDKGRYLICTESRRDEIAYYQPIGDKFSDYEPFWQGSSCRFTSVTHWQPLPKPPKGE